MHAGDTAKAEINCLLATFLCLFMMLTNASRDFSMCVTWTLLIIKFYGNNVVYVACGNIFLWMCCVCSARTAPIKQVMMCKKHWKVTVSKSLNFWWTQKSSKKCIKISILNNNVSDLTMHHKHCPYLNCRFNVVVKLFNANLN